ncbi:MAG: ribosome silencing factor [Clostridia bacterium]|nr:ribosome silencing factor [Clostridia bacterium]
MPDLSAAEPKVWADTIVSLLDAHKAQEIKVLEVADQTIVADYFVLCTGTSNTQVKGLAGELEYKMGLANVPYLRMEGYTEGSWIILDYGSVLVHIFQRDTRDFYNLEKLWSDAKDIDISSLLK